MLHLVKNAQPHTAQVSTEVVITLPNSECTPCSTFGSPAGIADVSLDVERKYQDGPNDQILEVGKTEDYDGKLASAARLYLDRQGRRVHPEGYFTNGDKWYPSDGERCWCCSCIRAPSRNWPWSLNKHCRTFEHVAALMDVDVTDLRRVVRRLKTKQGGI